MAVKAMDGSMHHSGGRARLHDEMNAGKVKAAEPPVKKMTTEAPKKDPAGKGDSTTTIHEHVEQHGPAHKVEYHHDKATDQHHVTSHHVEGEAAQHHSTHDTAEEAHQHMGHAMDVPLATKEDPEASDEYSPDPSAQSASI